jgi:hypothetical protein
MIKCPQCGNHLRSINSQCNHSGCQYNHEQERIIKIHNHALVAKNLLENKTCDVCIECSDNGWDGAICGDKNQLFPKENTCEDWKLNPELIDDNT